MVRPLNNQEPIRPAHQPQGPTPTEKIPDTLQKVVDTTENFVINGRGKSALGAGKVPEFSDNAPHIANAVSQAATRSFQPKSKL